MIQDAVIRNLEIIGEAVRALPESLRQSNPRLPWRRMIGLRTVLAHEYFGVESGIVWGIVKRRLRPLKRPLRSILKMLDAAEARHEAREVQ